MSTAVGLPDVGVDSVKRRYAYALSVQNACNLSGVVHSFSDDVRVIAADLESMGLNHTEPRNRHPIVVLYVSKLHDLARLGFSSIDRYGLAHDFAQRVANGEIEPGTDHYHAALLDYYEKFGKVAD